MTTEPDKPKPRRRWLQYSLRTFFVVLTVFGVWLGVVVHRANEQRKAVEWVDKLGGSADYDYQLDEDGHQIGDTEPPGPQWVVELLGVDYFQEVHVVEWVHTQVSDVTPLAGLKDLRGLDLTGTQVTDLTPLRGLKHLTWLNLIDTPVSDLNPCANLSSLEWLLLDGTSVSDLTPLAGLQKLEWLHLGRTQVSDLTPLAKLTSLEILLLDSTPVNDVAPLAGLKHLSGLDLSGTQVAKAQVEELRRALPNCDIYWPSPSSEPSP